MNESVFYAIISRTGHFTIPVQCGYLIMGANDLRPEVYDHNEGRALIEKLNAREIGVFSDFLAESKRRIAELRQSLT